MRRNPAFDPRAVRDARYAAGMTVPDLAGRVEVSVGTVKAWEAGRRTPRAATQTPVATGEAEGGEQALPRPNSPSLWADDPGHKIIGEWRLHYCE